MSEFVIFCIINKLFNQLLYILNNIYIYNRQDKYVSKPKPLFIGFYLVIYLQPKGEIEITHLLLATHSRTVSADF